MYLWFSLQYSRKNRLCRVNHNSGTFAFCSSSKAPSEEQKEQEVIFEAYDMESTELSQTELIKSEFVTIYNKLSRNIRELGKKIKEIEPDHPFRIEQSAVLLEKLYMIGLISTKWDLSQTQKVTASCFCRRRLPVIMVRNKMSQTISMATKLIEQGHVRVGVEVVKDPAFLVTRNLEDFVTWVDTSAIKKHVLEYNNERDDFDIV